jgi:hypothetical protein
MPPAVAAQNIGVGPCRGGGHFHLSPNFIVFLNDVTPQVATPARHQNPAVALVSLAEKNEIKLYSEPRYGKCFSVVPCYSSLLLAEMEQTKTLAGQTSRCCLNLGLSHMEMFKRQVKLYRIA